MDPRQGTSRTVLSCCSHIPDVVKFDHSKSLKFSRSHSEYLISNTFGPINESRRSLCSVSILLLTKVANSSASILSFSEGGYSS